MAAGKRNASDREAPQPSRKKAALQETEHEPAPEPTDQQRLETLELKLQALGKENERLKERVETLEMRRGDQDSAQQQQEEEQQEELEDAKAQPKAKAPPKKTKGKAKGKASAAKAQPKGAPTSRRVRKSVRS